MILLKKKSLLFKMVIEQKNYGIEINCNDEDDNNKEINKHKGNVCVKLLKYFLKKKRKLKSEI